MYFILISTVQYCAELMSTGQRAWLAALEGYYGPPLSHKERVALVQFLAAHDYDAYAYSPKDDPFAREHWREPYPADELAKFAELVAVCDDAGLELSMTMNPGLDWRVDDPSEVDALTAKLEAFKKIGVRGLAVAWDDVPGEGAAVGASHGGAVATAFARLGADAEWFTCPVDYAASEPTTYLRAFADALPPEVGIVWTGTGIVSPRLTGADASGLSHALGRELLFGENFPVNDGGMAHVLHLGPYPTRDASFVAATKGAVVNFMHRPRASRVGLAVAARFWRNPEEDRYAAWEAVLAEFPGLEPLARACSSWVDNPEPDRRLLEWDNAELEAFLAPGCRDGLDAALAEEVEPWLAQWEAEATAMQAALWLLGSDAPVTMEEVGAMALAWYEARRSETQAFGVRFAYYPVSARDGDRLVSDPVSVVEGTNLTDRLCRRALDAVRP
jgi:hyaluronoglucosaminidase